MSDEFLYFINPFNGDWCDIIKEFGVIYSFSVLAVMFVRVIKHRIKDDWPINKQNVVVMSAVSTAIPTYFAYYSWFIAVIIQIILLVSSLIDNNKPTDLSTKLYDDLGISSYNEEKQKEQMIEYKIMTDEQKEEWKRKFGKQAYKESNLKIVLLTFFPSSLVIIGCTLLNNIYF